MTLQDIILKLQQYWSSQGCAIVLPWDIEKGAGTFNSATYLRALGPEPWNVAYVEPSRRPTDGRYGENPNRLERHHQFQVLLKPSPKNVQDLYLGSLQAIGIDPIIHDIRFVEDNWESPTLGAWGLGWEVWCDGQEITQFTYFQQCGGFDLDPIPVELTYGLDRIAMALQNVETVYDLRWGGALTYHNLRHAEEVQWSGHNFEHADIDLHLRWFKEVESECLRLCEAGVVIPAYDYCLRASHIFNVLDARGAIGVTERQAYILRVRQIAKACAESWLALRKDLNYPLLTEEGPMTVRMMAPSEQEAPTQRRRVEDSGEFLLELGTEEIPARLAPKAAKELLQIIQKQFDEWGLEVSGGCSDCTPRRIAVGFEKVPAFQESRDEVVKGPPTRIAYDADGNLTRAGQAFHDKVKEGDEVYRETLDNGEYLMVRRREEGRAVAELLAETMPQMLANLRWAKPMRWATEGTAFVRPIHWIVCSLDHELVPFRFAGVSSGLESYGHRFHSDLPFQVTSWSQLNEELAERKVILSSQKRLEFIEAEVSDLAASVGGQAVLDPALLEEVSHLCEWPVPMLGQFEEELLTLPREVIVTPMRVHQRYFPVQDDTGHLLPYFVLVGNTQVRDPDIVCAGNERVLRARLADASYFFKNDLKQSLDHYLPKLEQRIWLAQVGSVREKVDRVVALVTAVGGDADAQRTALLCRADLATEMVNEFPELQGTMGREYARRHQEPSEVSDGIFESYLPRFADDRLPETKSGTLVSIAERMDSIVACFGIGLKPTGSRDPYALRRQCLGVINMLATTNHSLPLDLGMWVDLAMKGHQSRVSDPEGCRGEVLDFFADRTRFLLRERLPTDVVDAVVGAGATRPKDVFGKIDALVELRESGGLEPILTTFKRVANITNEVASGAGYDASLLTEPTAAGLAQHLARVSTAADAAMAEHAFDRVVSLMVELRPDVDQFFDDILVMAEEPALRQARLGILGAIRDLFGKVADFTRIQDR